jgi:hypothetical protein
MYDNLLGSVIVLLTCMFSLTEILSQQSLV